MANHEQGGGTRETPSSSSSSSSRPFAGGVLALRLSRCARGAHEVTMCPTALAHTHAALDFQQLATGSPDMSRRVVSKTTGWNLPPSIWPLATAGKPFINEPSISERVPCAK
eukprot:3508764-Prymnesium_polylepis.1